MALLGAGGLPACSDDDAGPAPDATVDGGADGGVDGGGPVAPQPLEVTGWVGASVDPGDDPVYDAVAQGDFVAPAEGSDYLGLSWVRLATGEDGQLARPRVGLFYGVADIEVPEGHRVFARADSIYNLWVDNLTWQPGDVYHSRRHRVPLGVGGGSHTLVVRAYARNSAAELELWSTDAELVYNAEDLTRPDLVAGDASEQYLGIATLHLLPEPALEVTAEVLDSTGFAATAVAYPALGPSAVTQVSFRLRPKAAAVATPGHAVPATLRLSSPSWTWSYETTVALPVVAAGERYRQTRRSGVDHSTQYYGVLPPSGPAPAAGYGLILSLHGAGVEAYGQAGAYSPKSWAYLVAPTNRRRFGFDWEEWGRLDALEALHDAQQRFDIDPERVHLTGHSMGGHGSWHVGVHFADRFGVIAPSAGWISFEHYGGSPHPDGPVGRARQASVTLDFAENLAPRTVYILHGDADDNVPVTHARQMRVELQPIVETLYYHEEPGAGHWWDLDPDEAGADCVDWDPMLAVMEAYRREVTPLAFHWESAAPWVNPTYSYVTVRSAISPLENTTVDATVLGAEVTVDTTNVRSLTLDGDALQAAGIDTAWVDGAAVSVTAGQLAVGPQDGKRPAQHGPLNQVFHRPFCFVYDATGPAIYRHLAAYLLSDWNLIGNGHGCAVALAQLPPELGQTHNLVFLGIPSDALPGAPALPFSWDDAAITVDGRDYADAALAFVYPAGDRLHAYFTATAGAEFLLFGYVPFSSRAGMPDYLLWADGGLLATGFFDARWQLDPAYAVGL
jgi:dienelactone hydrolase